MKIRVNGKERLIEAQRLSVAGLLSRENVENPDMVSVQLNGEFIDKGKFKAAYLKDGDMVDFLYFMGGGRG